MRRHVPWGGVALCFLVASAGTVPADSAHAHWCHDLWAGAYNIVVKPESDVLVVPEGGEATLDFWVENNMGYPLVDFELTAVPPTGYVIENFSRGPSTVTSYLMPGERQRHSLTLSHTGGATLNASELEFSITFGWYADGTWQWDWYPWNDGKPVMMKLNSGDLSPDPALDLGAAHGQARHLGSGAIADFGATADGINDLLEEFCVGRSSYSSNSTSVMTSTYCPDLSTTTCAGRATRGHTKYDYQHLWASEFLAARKSALSGDQLGALRDRLECAYDDDHFTFRAFTLMMLGYLGEDADARTHLEDVIFNGSANDLAVAKAALLLFRDGDDRSAYHGDVVAGISSSNDFVASASAVSIAILDSADSALGSILSWDEPDSFWHQPETSNNGLAFYAGHLLDLAAWHRRGWAPRAGDEGEVSFYGGTPDEIPPAAPEDVTCTPQTGGQARIEWSQVDTDSLGHEGEVVTEYRVYRGPTARPGGVTLPDDPDSPYDHMEVTANIYQVLSGLEGGATYYVAVTAVDAAGNHSVFSAEVSCLIAETNEAPIAVLACTPSSGVAPLDVTCDAHLNESTGTRDPDGADDIAEVSISLDGSPIADSDDGVVELSFPDPGSHTASLYVEDQGGLSDTDGVAIQVTAPVNSAPTAVAAADPTSGDAPLEANFSGAGSSDPDGDTLTYAWDFDDDGATSTEESPAHTFTEAGTYLVSLTVTDDGSPPLGGTDVVSVAVHSPNQPPAIGVACDPARGEAPLTTTCSVSGGDPDGTIAHYYFSLDGAAEEEDANGDGVRDYSFSNPGTHSVVLRAVDDGGLDDTATATVTVDPGAGENLAPEVVATAIPESGTAPLEVTFDASASTDPEGDGLTFSWAFGDGSEPATSATTTHTFTTAGDYIATITVTDDGTPNAQAVAAYPIEVNDPESAPTAVLSCDPTAGPAPLSVTCDGSASSDADGTIVAHYFILDGAAPSDGTSAQVDYEIATPGNHSVLLRVVDDSGLEDTDQVTVQVSGTANQPPVAVATGTPTSGDAPLEVSFSGTESSDPDGDSLTYAWDFDDGDATSTEVEPTHTFAEVGAYTVTLTVTDDGTPPLSGVAVVDVTVGEAVNTAPVVTSASATPLFGPAPLAVHFDATGVYDLEEDTITLAWDFGDAGATSTEAAADHTYDAEGQYEAVLTADDDGTPDLDAVERRFTISVTDNNPPNADAATVEPLSGPAPLTVTMDATGCSDPDGDGLAFRWQVILSFSETATYTEAAAQHTFTEPTTYEVMLTVTDDADVPLEVTRRFSLEVTGDGEEDGGGPTEILSISQGCVCASSRSEMPAGLLIVVLFVLAMVRRRG